MKNATRLLLLLLSLPIYASEPTIATTIDVYDHLASPPSFHELNHKSQIILTINDLSDSNQWSLTYQLIDHLHQTGWLRKVLLGSVPVTADTIERFDAFNAAPKHGMRFTNLMNLLGQYSGDMAMLALLQELHVAGIKVHPGTTAKYSAAKEAFARQYGSLAARTKRYQQIKKMLPPQGLATLNGYFGQAHPESLNSMYYLNAQIEQDEATAFYSSEPGTLIIMPPWVHASKLTGVGAVLPASNPFLQVAGVYISHSEEEVINHPFTPPQQKAQMIERLKDTASNFHYWFVPKP